MTDIIHTPGPWHYRQSDDNDSIAVSFDFEMAGIEPDPSDGKVYPNNAMVICHCKGPDREANAALISAAPDLLWAAQCAMYYLEKINRGTRLIEEDWGRTYKTLQDAVLRAVLVEL